LSGTREMTRICCNAIGPGGRIPTDPPINSGPGGPLLRLNGSKRRLGLRLADEKAAKHRKDEQNATRAEGEPVADL
jgi:hypothetical protein